MNPFLTVMPGTYGTTGGGLNQAGMGREREYLAQAKEVDKMPPLPVGSGIESAQDAVNLLIRKEAMQYEAMVRRNTSEMLMRQSEGLLKDAAEQEQRLHNYLQQHLAF